LSTSSLTRGRLRSQWLATALPEGATQIIGGFWAYAGILEYLQHFSPGRHPSIADFAASALGAFCGGLASALLWRRRLPV
jgi:VanZ family protein